MLGFLIDNISDGKIEVISFVKEAGRKLIISVYESKIKGFSGSL
jgi:hypothetical protein